MENDCYIQGIQGARATRKFEQANSHYGRSCRRPEFEFTSLSMEAIHSKQVAANLLAEFKIALRSTWNLMVMKELTENCPFLPINLNGFLCELTNYLPTS